MKCRNCHFENPLGMKYCGGCGAELTLICPNCSASNPQQFKFCGECGQNLTPLADPSAPRDLSFDEKLAKIQKYLPGGLTEKILSQKDRIEGERRHVTIMFVDMKGFTPLAEKLGPEETFSLMDKVFELIIHKVHEYEGTVNELRGDGVLAYFGAPIALEDAPQRAIRSSLAIHRELTRFNDKLKNEKNIPPVLVRIGINSGPVVVGTVGNDLRVQFTAVGDTINMAARMEQLAEPGTTYVTEDTFKLTEGLFRFEALGEKEIKGKEKPLRVYRVIAPSTRTTRFDVSAERGLSRFIGRERELELLIDAFERAKAGRGQAVSIMGEAGVGKSRLLYEFRKAVANEEATFLEGKCLSYSRGVAYHPIIDILKSSFAIEDGEPDSGIAGKVKRGLSILGIDEAPTLPYLLELLSVKESGIDQISMSPDAKKDRIIGALQRLILKGAERRPLIYAFEDLHWMDKSSEEAAKYLMESIPGARVLMIFTYRPEFVHTWGGKSFHSQVTLNRLSNRESLTLVANLLGSDNIAPDLQDLILEKTEGVPFFTEEFVRSLRDMGIIERTNYTYHLPKDLDHISIPSTIQDVIMARVDSLPEAAKEVLHAGSAIEREFSYELIKAVTELPEPELLSHLSVLKDAELLYERGIFPQSTYIFRHALTREVVYDSILAKRKKLLHERIGKSIEEIYSENLSDHYGILAEHYLASENYENASQVLLLAGKRAARRGSLSEAITHAERRITALEKLRYTDQLEETLIDTRMYLGLYYSLMNCHVDAYHAVVPVVDLAAKHANPKRLSMIYTITGSYHSFVREDFEPGLKDLTSAVEISIAAQAFAPYAQACFWMGFLLYQLRCDFENGLNYFQRALQLAVATNNLWSISSIKSNIALLLFFQGSPLAGLEMSTDAVRLAEESGDILAKCRAYVSHGLCLYGRGFLKEAIENFSHGSELCYRADYLAWNGIAQNGIAEVLHTTNEFHGAVGHHEEAMRLIERSGMMPSWVLLCKTGLGLANIMYGQRGVDLNSLCSDAIRSKAKLLVGWTRRNLGASFLNIDYQHIHEAQHWIEQAIEADERNGMRWHLARDIAVYAELFKRKGDREKAKEQVGRAIDIYKECGADGWVTRAEEEMARLS